MKAVVEKMIDTLRKATNVLTNAYVETYGDKFLAREFNSQVKMRKEYHKQRFIAEMATRYAKKCKEDGLMIMPGTAFEVGVQMFHEAKQKGDLDELNNLIPPKED